MSRRAFLSGVAIAATQFPLVVATLNLVAQQANIPAATLLYAIPVGAGGRYRVTCQTVVTKVSSTGGGPNLPQVNLNWTDLDTGVAEPVNPWLVIALTPLGHSVNLLGYNSLEDVQTDLNSASVLLIGDIPPQPFRAKGGTNILVSSSGYAAGTGTPMQYNAYFTAEYLGP